MSAVGVKYISPMRFPKSFRAVLRENNAADRFYAKMAGKEPMAQNDVPEKRVVVRNLERVSEADVNAVIREFSERRGDLVLWRNNRGMVDLPGGGKLRYGTGPNGASDWLGYKRVVITQDMVGQTLAVFAAVEAKAPDAGAVPEHQQEFLRAVLRAGGIGIVVREKADLEKL